MPKKMAKKVVSKSEAKRVKIQTAADQAPTEACEICRVKPAVVRVVTKKGVTLVLCKDDKAAMKEKVGIKTSENL